MPRASTTALLLAALAGLAWWPVADAGFDRYHLPKEFGLALCALGATVRGPSATYDAVSRWALALLALTCVSMLLATTPSLAQRGAALVLINTALFLSARRLSPREATLVRGAVVLGASLVALVALGEVFDWWAGLSATGRAPGATLGQRNMVAHLLLLVSPAAWTLASRATTRRGTLLALLATALLAGGVLVTRSRAAWLTAAPVLAVWLWLTWRAGHRPLGPVVALGFALTLAASVTPQIHWKAARPYADTLSRLVDSQQGSGRGRLIQYEATLKLVAAHPLFGVGPSNWMVEYPTVSPPGDPTLHTSGLLRTGRLVNSDWLALASEGGGLALFAACVLGLLVGRGALRSKEGPLALAMLVALMGLGSLDAVLQLPAAGASSALLLGSCLADDGPRQPTPFLRAGLALGLLLAAGLAALRLIGLSERSRGGVDHLEAALRWNPADLEARFALAEAFVLEGNCAQAAPHVRFLLEALPRHAQPRHFAQSCPP